ncbi:MAG: DedA family protein [Flavobacteriales bacterium]
METWEFIKTLFNPESIIHYGGLSLLLLVLFLENGAFFGFFLPGDSLMFTAGLLTATGVLDHTPTTVVTSMFIAGMGGYQFGWWTGRRTGESMKNKPDTFWFRKKHMALAEDYYKKYGGKTLIIGRFVPIVRTFAPIVAGVIHMPVGKFTLYNFIGMALWVGTIFTSGYYLGREFPWILDYLGWIVVWMIVFATLPVVLQLRAQRKEKQAKEGKPR